MSTVKNVSKSSTTTKEKTVTTSKTKQETTDKSSNKKATETQKKVTEKQPDGKELTKKSNITKNLLNETTKRTSEKPIRSNAIKTSPNPKLPSSKSKLAASAASSSSSSRVKKSQYFPSKHLYSNALKSVEIQSKIAEDSFGTNLNASRISALKKSTTTSSPRNKNAVKDIPVSIVKSRKENKQLETPVKKKSSVKGIPGTVIERREEATARDSSPETSSMLERPRTATLRKGSIVNENIVGPEAPKTVKKVPVIKEVLVAKPASPDESNYEDDFDSYESDFEAATTSSSFSADVNLQNISGKTSSSDSVEDIAEKKSSPNNENKRLSSAGTDDERKLDSGTFELSDFKHRQILRYIEDTLKKEDVILEQDINKKSAINHASLSDEGFEDQKSLQFINFADAKKKCDKKRASEARRKRGEELLGMIKLDAISFTIFDLPSVPYEIFISNYGHGDSVQVSVQTGDDALCEETQTNRIVSNNKWTQMPTKFSSFDSSNWGQYRDEYKGTGSDRVTFDETVLKQNDTHLIKFLRHSSDLILQIMSEENINKFKDNVGQKNDLPFSNGYLQFKSGANNSLENTRLENVYINSVNVMTVHVKTHVGPDCIQTWLCIWEVDDLQSPRRVLIAFGQVCCAMFGNKYVVAGQTDGAVLVWNLKSKHHQYEILSRTPSFLTAVGSSHFSKIVSVQCVVQNAEDQQLEDNEVCTLDETGIIIIWTLYPASNPTNDIILINSQLINLQEIYPQFSDLICSDCIVMDKHIYVSTSYGFILHHLTNSSQSGIKMFQAPDASKIHVTCLETCPFSSSYFLAGYSNGNVSLFSTTNSKPLLILQNTEQIDSCSIQIIQWSKTKPFLFYVKDSKNTIHVWDLCKSDMYPEYSIPFSQNISCMRLSPALNNAERSETAYMLIGTKNGEIYLHLLSKQYSRDSLESYQKDVKVFLNYVNRL